MKLLKGTDYIRANREMLLKRAQALPRAPRLAVVRVGERPDDLSYERGAAKRLSGFGAELVSVSFPEDVQLETFLDAFGKLNADPLVDGILLLRPLPRHLDESAVIALLDPDKDVDGITPQNMAKLFMGASEGFAPCTAEAALRLLKTAIPDLTGKRAVVIGRSLVVGKPLAMLLLAEHCTVTICHSRTENLAAVCRDADILAAAAGKAGLVDGSFASDEACILDIGIHVREDGSMCGDVAADSFAERDVLLTPVPGGVGSVTTMILTEHLIRACERKMLQRSHG